jgi:hypothetical protein
VAFSRSLLIRRIEEQHNPYNFDSSLLKLLLIFHQPAFFRSTHLSRTRIQQANHTLSIANHDSPDVQGSRVDTERRLDELCVSLLGFLKVYRRTAFPRCNGIWSAPFCGFWYDSSLRILIKKVSSY